MKTIPPELEGEYTVRVMDMPVSTPGFVTYDEDDHANIYLNARYSREKNRRTAAHELTHVLHDDIHNADPIQVIESRADLPPLVKASALLPSLPPLGKVDPAQPETKEVSRPPLTPHQLRAVNTAISTLDRFIFEGFDDL